MGDSAKTAVFILPFLNYVGENKSEHTLMLVGSRSVFLAGLVPPLKKVQASLARLSKCSNMEIIKNIDVFILKWSCTSKIMLKMESTSKIAPTDQIRGLYASQLKNNGAAAMCPPPKFPFWLNSVLTIWAQKCGNIHL